MFRTFAAVAVAMACVVAWPASALADGHAVKQFGPGASGIGDLYFPFDGNGGYDVKHYDLGLAYDPSTDVLQRRRQDQGEGDAEPVELQPRPQRHDRPLDQGQPPPRDLEPGRRRADRHPTARPAEAPAFHHRRGLRRCAGARRRLAAGVLGLHRHRRRHGGRRAARGRRHVVPGQRPSARQGRLHVPHQGARRPRGDGQRRVEKQPHPPRIDDLGLGREGADGLLPHHGDHRRIRPACVPGGRHPLLGCDRPGPLHADLPAHGRRVRALADGGLQLQAAVSHDQRACRRVAALLLGNARHRARLGLHVRRGAPGGLRRLDHAARSQRPYERQHRQLLPGGLAGDPSRSSPHYQTVNPDGSCSPTGTTGVWQAASGVSDGYEPWAVDLSDYAGQDVEVSISYASDDERAARGRVPRRCRGLEAVLARPGSRTTATRWTAGPSPDRPRAARQRDRLDRGNCRGCADDTGRDRGRLVRAPAGDHRVPLGHLRALPVLGRRRDRRRHPGSRLRPRDPDPADLRAGLLRRARRAATRSSSTSSPTSGSATTFRSRAGGTSGSTRASRRTPSGCGASARGSGPRRRSSTTSPRHPRRRPVLER